MREHLDPGAAEEVLDDLGQLDQFHLVGDLLLQQGVEGQALVGLAQSGHGLGSLLNGGLALGDDELLHLLERGFELDAAGAGLGQHARHARLHEGQEAAQRNRVVFAIAGCVGCHLVDESPGRVLVAAQHPGVLLGGSLQHRLHLADQLAHRRGHLGIGLHLLEQGVQQP